MLERGNIIESALLKVGNITDYNDNRSDIYKVADKLLNNVVDMVCKSNEFSFNSTTVILTQSGVDSVTGEYRYNIPEDFLGVKKQIITNAPVPFGIESVVDLVNANKRESFRLQGEYIYSYNTPLRFNYSRKMILTELPDYMTEYITLLLAKSLAMSIRMYADSLPTIDQYLKTERTNVILAEKSSATLQLRGGI